MRALAAGVLAAIADGRWCAGTSGKAGRVRLRTASCCSGWPRRHFREIAFGVERDAGPALDSRAKAEYRLRLEDLRAEIEEAEAFNDPERAARAREEMDFIAHELSAAVGLGGRDRPASSAAERARVNVTRALRREIRRIADEDARLGRELET